jgi:hypothetical protein
MDNELFPSIGGPCLKKALDAKLLIYLWYGNRARQMRIGHGRDFQ